MAPDDLDGDVGSPDVGALEQIHATFVGLAALVDANRTGLDDLVDPQELHVRLDDGIGDAEWARFDVTWYRTGCYSFHHVDSDAVNFRWDHHPKDGAPDRNFQPAPNAPSDDAEASCITVDEPGSLPAIHKLWRRAYESGSLAALNDGDNPP